MTKLRVSHAGKGVPVSGQIQRNKVHHFPQFLSFKEPEFVRVFLTRLEITTSVIPRLAGLSITGAHLRPPLSIIHYTISNGMYNFIHYNKYNVLILFIYNSERRQPLGQM